VPHRFTDEIQPQLQQMVNLLHAPVTVSAATTAVELSGDATGPEKHAFSSDGVHSSSLLPPANGLDQSSVHGHGRSILSYPGNTFGEISTSSMQRMLVLSSLCILTCFTDIITDVLPVCALCCIPYSSIRVQHPVCVPRNSTLHRTSAL
jgi:hypothetical protein